MVAKARLAALPIVAKPNVDCNSHLCLLCLHYDVAIVLFQLRKSTKSRSKEERKYQVKLKNERNREKREYERKRRKERHGQHRSSGLVAEKLIPVSKDRLLPLP